MHGAKGAPATAKGGGGAEVQGDEAVGGREGFLGPVGEEVFEAVVAGLGMTAWAAEDFVDVEGDLPQVDGGRLRRLEEVLDEGVEQVGVEQGDAQPSFLACFEVQLSISSMAKAL